MTTPVEKEAKPKRHKKDSDANTAKPKTKEKPVSNIHEEKNIQAGNQQSGGFLAMQEVA